MPEDARPGVDPQRLDTPPDETARLRLGVRVLVQRVSSASVTIDGRTAGAIGGGLLLLVGFTHADTDASLEWMAEKVCGLRIFSDADGKMNLSVLDTGGSALVVSQFTLYGDAAKGKRPSFIDAARPEQAIPLYERFVALLRARLPRVETGEFGADMKVALVNDGPVTLWLER
jgi:D-tyrosyl-tRNA(Tyr) deacylase